MQARFATAVLLGFVLAAVAACGGGDGSVETADPGGSPLTYAGLSAGQIVTPGTYHILGAPDDLLEELYEAAQPAGGYAPGTEITVAGVGLRCASDSPANCSVTLHDDGSFTTTGIISIVQTGDAFPMTDAEQIAEANERAEEEKARADAAEQAEADAKQEAADAEQARQEEEERRLAAEAESQRLANEAEERRKADATEAARVQIAGTRMIGNDTTLDVGPITHGEPAPVTVPLGPFTTTTGGSGSWSTTSLTVNREPTRDMVQIYTDIEMPEQELFSGSSLNIQNVGGPQDTPPPGVIDGEGDVVGWVNLVAGTPNRIATSGSFPSDSGNPEPFRLVDRFHSETEFGDLTWDNGAGDNNGNGRLDEDEEGILETEGVTRSKFLQYIAGSGFRETKRFPERWAYETSGFLQGASGRYRCDSDSAPAATTCTVQNNGGSFTFAGDWDFIPSSGTVRIVVPDAQYMWFGWWARQTVRLNDPANQSTETWAFEADHGGNAVTQFAGATGTATYQGPAAGRYAVYEPDTGESGIGSFTASATLQADFDASPNTVSGSITNFSNDPSWSLALKRKGVNTDGIIAAADNSNSVTWTIDGVQNDSGDWEAAFYSNLMLPSDGTIAYQPHGIAGTFEAEYDPSGVGARAAVIGGFGAHR